MSPDDFVEFAKDNPSAAEKKIIALLSQDRLKIEMGEITAGTVNNWLKAVRLFSICIRQIPIQVNIFWTLYKAALTAKLITGTSNSKQIMAIAYTSTEEIKKDVQELTKIAIEDRIPEEEIRYIYQLAAQGTLQYIEPHLKHKIIVSEIVGREIISRRFADKALLLLSKYDQRDRTLLLECTMLLYLDSFDK